MSDAQGNVDLDVALEFTPAHRPDNHTTGGINHGHVCVAAFRGVVAGESIQGVLRVDVSGDSEAVAAAVVLVVVVVAVVLVELVTSSSSSSRRRRRRSSG